MVRIVRTTDLPYVLTGEEMADGVAYGYLDPSPEETNEDGDLVPLPPTKAPKVFVGKPTPIKRGIQ